MYKLLLITIPLLMSMFITTAQSTLHVNAVEFNNLMKSEKGVILDVRTPQEYSRGHIDGSTLINIADREFTTKVNLLQKDKPVYIYCLTGSRSRAAANYMAQQGFSKVYNLQRGILDWQQNNLPVVQSQATVASKSKTYSKSDFDQLVQSEKLVLVDFHAVWCAPCKQMSPVIDKLSQNYKGKVKVEKIDVEANREIAQSNQIQSIPGFVLFKDGKKAWTHKGMITYAELENVLNNNM